MSTLIYHKNKQWTQVTRSFCLFQFFWFFRSKKVFVEIYLGRCEGREKEMYTREKLGFSGSGSKQSKKY